MSNLHRILWIDSQIRSRRFPNCRTISERFEISSRQASRDIEYLRSSLGAPVEFNAARNGYYYLNETFILPSQYITDEEKQALSYLALRYERYGGNNAKRIAGLFTRLTGSEGDNTDHISKSVPLYDISPNEISKYESLSKSIAAHKKVQMTYKNSQNNLSTRLFCPYLLFPKNDIDYIVGFCEYRNEIRIFRLERIKDIVLTDIEFRVVPYFNPVEYKNSRSFEFKKPYTAIIKTNEDKKMKELGIFSKAEGDSFAVEFANSRDFLHKLMQIENEYTILSPEWLKDRLRTKLENILKNHFSYDIIRPTPSNIIISSIDKAKKAGGSHMSKRILENIKMGDSWTSYISAAYGCLAGAGLWREDICKMMAMTGMAFHFIVHRQLCPSSVTVYDWTGEHFTMMDRIGIHSEVYQLFFDTRLNTYELAQQDAVKRIKESIDSGMAVVVWAPTPILEFGIINGYDDLDKVFYVQDCTGRQVDPLQYTNLGRAEVPILFYQIFKGKVEIDKKKAYYGALKFALSEWNKEYHVDPNYGSGRKGYLNLINAIEKNDYNIFGLSYILAVYKGSKLCSAEFLKLLDAEKYGFKGIDKAFGLYYTLSENFNKMSSLLPFNLNQEMLDKAKVPEILTIIKECMKIEEEAMGLIADSV